MPNQRIGILYVVATPIGNLKDITLRAIEVLKSVDRIAAEDTRHSKRLLDHFSIQKPTLSLHEFNERQQIKKLITFLEAGESIALLSDAGTPLISDPGFCLVRAMREAGMKVSPIPGPCAAIAALSAAGLPTDKFIFEGFLPAKREACRHHLEKLFHETRTIIFYEAPHRLLSLLQIMGEVFGSERKAAIARELTKIHETILTADLKSLIQELNSHPETVRGEIVILLQGAHENNQAHTMQSEAVLDLLLKELPLKQAVMLASEITGERKNVLYEKALAKKG